jgi:chemotaxis protein MotB
MKTPFRITIQIALGACIVLSSCVTKKKYLSSVNHTDRLQTDSIQKYNRLEECNSQVKKLTDEKDLLQSKNQATQKDLQDLASKSKLTIADQARRLKDLQDLIQSQKNAMNKLKKTIADALVNFKADELSVHVEDGKVYVSLQEKLLFKSGSAMVDPKGKEALSSLASVLNVTPDISVMIEGHTDTVPIKRNDFIDNWALSAGRATSIVSILTNDYDVDPHRIIAAGRGEFHPIKPNDTNEGKASNRRTEIIISPNLNELYKLIGD